MRVITLRSVRITPSLAGTFCHACNCRMRRNARMYDLPCGHLTHAICLDRLANRSTDLNDVKCPTCSSMVPTRQGRRNHGNRTTPPTREPQIERSRLLRLALANFILTLEGLSIDGAIRIPSDDSDSDEPNPPQVQSRSRIQCTKIKYCDSSKSSTDCIMCCEDYSDDDLLYRLPCKHELHASCIDKYANTGISRVRCPICRHPINIQ